jgi:hypothetical protein
MRQFFAAVAYAIFWGGENASQKANSYAPCMKKKEIPSVRKVSMSGVHVRELSPDSSQK